jgi:hypothetical protein
VAGKSARGPDGREWRVQREWVKRGPRWRRSARPNLDHLDDVGNPLEAADGCLDLEGLLYLLVIVVALFLIWFFVLPALLFAFDLLFLLLSAAVGIAFRILFRRPWHVVAETPGPPPERVDIPVVGYRASGAKVDEVAWRIGATGTPLGR